ncbi:MAG: hypothetical protein ACREXY_01940 [Gammaproteobacteria bacterium]
MLSIPTAEMDRSLATVVPHTTSLRGTRFEVTVSVPFLRIGGFDAQGIVTVPTVRLIRHLGTLKPEQLNTVVKGRVSVARNQRRVLKSLHWTLGTLRAPRR